MRANEHRHPLQGSVYASRGGWLYLGGSVSFLLSCLLPPFLSLPAAPFRLVPPFSALSPFSLLVRVMLGRRSLQHHSEALVRLSNPSLDWLKPHLSVNLFLRVWETTSLPTDSGHFYGSGASLRTTATLPILRSTPRWCLKRCKSISTPDSCRWRHNTNRC